MADKTRLNERNELVNKETNRLKRIYSNIDSDKMKVVDGLITQSARLKVLLDEMWVDITNNGDYEEFRQSEKVEPYERERPVAKLYNSRDQAYQKVIRQLTDLLPEEDQAEDDGYTEDDLL